eukprot:m.44737 g.44737  ORF g.44737 m.44737 type:complete len:59 (+) comp12125_c1_seq1:117-293(+)
MAFIIVIDCIIATPGISPMQAQAAHEHILCPTAQDQSCGLSQLLFLAGFEDDVSAKGQ